jgi:hypothetical protein
VSDIESFEKSQEENQSKWTNEQQRVIGDYADYASGQINKELREGRSGDFVRVMDSLFRSPQGTLNQSVKVRRFVSNAHPLVQMLKKGVLDPGCQFVDLGYQSTSINTNWKVHGMDYSFEIDVPKGSRAVYVGQSPPSSFGATGNEHELILNRGSKLEILGVEGTVIKARVVNKE